MLAGEQSVQRDLFSLLLSPTVPSDVDLTPEAAKAHWSERKFHQYKQEAQLSQSCRPMLLRKLLKVEMIPFSRACVSAYYLRQRRWQMFLPVFVCLFVC